MIQRYDIAEAPWGLAIDPEDDGEWVKWEDVKDMICIRMENELEEFRAREIADENMYHSDEVEFWKSRAISLYRDLQTADSIALEAWEAIPSPANPVFEWENRS